MAELKRLIEIIFPGVSVNSALINYYPHLNSVLNLHSDDENEIQMNSFIITVSYGTPRKILFATKEKIPKPIMYVVLNNRSVLIFSRNSQNYFKHGIIADCEPTGHQVTESRRVSITFRLLGQLCFVARAGKF